MSKGKFVLLSIVMGLVGFAVASGIAGYIFDMMGDRHPHGPGPVLIAIIAMIYFAPVGALIGLVSSLILKDRSFKKVALILVICFVVLIAAVIGYFKR
jgi:MFS family permease